MSRVSENSSFHAIKYSTAKTKSKLEDLQIKGSNLKRVQKPSDDPVGNIDILSIRSQKIDNNQFVRNANVAKSQLAYTENALEELSEIVNKAKELGIGQSSSLFNENIRMSVAKEISQLRQQALGIANRRMGNKYIFAGHKSLTRPFDQDGKFYGDANQTKLEVAKDFFVPVNFSGDQVFFEKENTQFDDPEKLDMRGLQNTPIDTGDEEFQDPIQRDLASTDPNQNLNQARRSLFDNLESLENALLSNSHEMVQELLPMFDENLDQLVVNRTKIGSIMNSIDAAIEGIEKDNLTNEEFKSRIEDADVAELFTDLTRQQNVLNATYKASAQLMNRSLMDFIQ